MVLYRLKRAWEALDEANVLFEHGHTAASVNRLYYACFYAVSSLLLTGNFSSSKHSGVRRLFHEHFVKTGEVSTELGKFYDLIYDNRQKSDYADLVIFERGDVEPWIALARDMVSAVHKLIEARIGPT